MRPNQRQKKSEGFWAAVFHRIPFIAGAILAILFLAYLFLNENGLPLYLQMMQKEDELQRQTHQLQESNQNLGESIRQIQDDPTELEEIARDQLGMVREGEVVYQFVEPKSDHSRTLP